MRIGSYLGLIPCEDFSADPQRLGHIIKQGSSLWRFLLVEAAQAAVRWDLDWRRRFVHLAMRRDRRIAKVAMARKLAVSLYWMWRRGKRDYVIIALFVGCALRRRELATLNIEDIQLREGRWVIIDLRGKGGRIRTVAVPIWMKQGINAWMTAAKIEGGRPLRPVSKSGKLLRDALGDWAIWSVVEQ